MLFCPVSCSKRASALDLHSPLIPVRYDFVPRRNLLHDCACNCSGVPPQAPRHRPGVSLRCRAMLAQG